MRLDALKLNIKIRRRRITEIWIARAEIFIADAQGRVRVQLEAQARIRLPRKYHVVFFAGNKVLSIVIRHVGRIEDGIRTTHSAADVRSDQ